MNTTALDVSVVLPTYNEAKNLPVMIPAIIEALKNANINGEVIVVDDQSPDQTGNVSRLLAKTYAVQTIVRQERGLATAVLTGFNASKASVVVVMDADGSHPVNRLSEMIRPILDGKADITVGSRYMPGGEIDNWPVHRLIISKGASMLTRGITNMSDPTSGFMAIKRELTQTHTYNPVGWKIVLEIVVKTTPARLKEIPISFSDRIHGESKLTLKQNWEYLRHLRRLYAYRYQTLLQFLKFSLVGGSGVLIDMLIVALLKESLDFNIRLCAIFGFLGAVGSNYILNKFWTFKANNHQDFRKFVTFIGICSIGLSARIMVIHVLDSMYGTLLHYQLINLAGIVMASAINFWGSKRLVFSPRRPKTPLS